MNRFIPLLLFLLATTACTQSRDAPHLTLAAASSVSQAMESIVKDFTGETGIHVDITTGSTGVLALQLREGAPFDLFFGADRETAEQLANDGHLDRETLRTYAVGELVLWKPRNNLPELSQPRDLLGNAWKKRRIAIANPETAPYGRAALRVIRQLDTEGLLTDRIIPAGSVRTAWQITQSGNADAAFVAVSVLGKEGEAQTLRLDDFQDSRIPHKMGISTDTKHRNASERFAAFMKTETAINHLLHAGLNTPP